jgi:hypothetical protein
MRLSSSARCARRRQRLLVVAGIARRVGDAPVDQPALTAPAAPFDNRAQSASAICERLLLPVHRNRTRASVEARFRLGCGRVVGARAARSPANRRTRGDPERSCAARRRAPAARCAIRPDSYDTVQEDERLAMAVSSSASDTG